MLHACSHTPAAAQVGGISELLAQRSAVDLKDKWRNLVRLGCWSGTGSVLRNQTPSRAPPTVLGLKCSAVRFHRHRMTRLLHSHKRCSRTCHLQTRVAKLPKSVLKARAHKSTSDIPLDLLLAGEFCRFMLCCAVPCWAASRCAVLRHAVRCCMVLDAAQLRGSWHLCCDRAEVPLPAACALQ